MRINEIWRMIPPGRRKWAVSAVAGSVVLALLDFAGVAVLVSVLLFVLDGNVFEEGAVARVYGMSGFGKPESFIAAVCIMVLVIIAVKNALSLGISNYVRKYTLSLYRHYSVRMLDIYLSRGLPFIRSHNTSELANNVNGLCLRFADGVLGQLMAVISDGILLLFIMAALALYNPPVVLFAAAVFIPFAIVYSRVLRHRMAESGRKENELFVRQNKLLAESLKGYSDVRLHGAEEYVSGKFREGLHEMTGYRRSAALARQGSGRMAEVVLVLAVTVIIVAGLWLGKPMGSLRILLGVFALAAYKIVPASSRMVNGWLECRRNLYAGDIIRDAFEDLSDDPLRLSPATTKITFEREMELKDISFAYDGGDTVLDGFSMIVKKGERIGFRGPSGAGKTTLFNIVAGLLKPDSGCITVDGRELAPDNISLWQRNLSYVSQDLFIADISLAENIAFGVTPDKIDHDRLERVIRSASLDGLVGSLPEGVDTVTGETGCRLSGGEKQRIGMARALYKEASVLLLDEATSSLDPATEDEILTAIEELAKVNPALTILIISHHDRTLSFCDRMIDLGQPSGKTCNM